MYFYDDTGCVVQTEEGPDFSSCPLTGARGINTSTNMVANVRIQRYDNGQVFTDTVGPGQTKDWAMPGSWRGLTLRDVQMGAGCGYV